MVADEAEAPLGVETFAIERDDARRFLPAMLQGVQAERGDRGGFGMAENAEDAAFLTEPSASRSIVVGRSALMVSTGRARAAATPPCC